MDPATTSNPANHLDYTFNIALVGNECVGKSSMVLQYLRDKIITQDQKVVKLHIKDPHGALKYRPYILGCYLYSAGFIAVYDITDEQSFRDMETWIGQLKKSRVADSALLVLVGNKTDLEEQRKVTHEQGQELAKLNGALFYEISAKSSESVNSVFEGLTSMLLDQRRPLQEEKKNNEIQDQVQKQSETQEETKPVENSNKTAQEKDTFPKEQQEEEKQDKQIQDQVQKQSETQEETKPVENSNKVAQDTDNSTTTSVPKSNE